MLPGLGTRRPLPEAQSQITFAYPGDLMAPTGGYGYDRRVIAGLCQLGWQVDTLSLGDGFPFPDETTLAEAERKLALLPERSQVVVDGLAFGVMDAAARRLGERFELIALVHHPLCLENGLSELAARHLRETENRALQCARRVVVTSPATAGQVRDLFDIPSEQISVALPGTDRAVYNGKISSGNVRLLSVGTISPRKGYDLLFRALADLKDLEWELGIAGAVHFDPDCYAGLQSFLKEEGLEDRVTFFGAVESEILSGLYDEADIFVLASRYEGYGMAYTEALAHGLPVIGSGAGSVRTTLPEEASIYCGVEDVSRLKEALASLIENPERRQKLADGARVAAERLPTWTDTANAFVKALGKKA